MSYPFDTVLDVAKVREVEAVFRTREALDAAIDNLLLVGFDRADIDLVADPDRVYRRLGTLAVRAEDLADVPDTPGRLSSPARRRVGYTTPTAGRIRSARRLVFAP
jgi:hypothetical protein